MAYYLKGADNQGAKSSKRLASDKRLTARKLVDELNRRIDSGQLSEVSTDLLINFLGKTLPKEHNINNDYQITYVSNIPRLEDKPIEIEAECREDDGCQYNDGE